MEKDTMPPEITVVLCRVSEPAEVGKILSSFEAISEFVGGVPEMFWVEPRVQGICREGANRRDPDSGYMAAIYNCAVPTVHTSDRQVHYVYGDFLLCGPSWRSLNRTLAKAWVYFLNHPGSEVPL